MLEALRRDIVEANEKLNLTRITQERDYWIRHVADSLAIGMVMPGVVGGEMTAVDVGCGCGFPLLALAWANPALRITGLEPKKRKAAFVSDEIKKLGIGNASVACVQAREHHRQYDAVLARAVGQDWRMVRACRHLIKGGGSMVLYKTPGADLDLVRREAGKFGLDVAVSGEFELPCESGKRCFVMLEKPA
jgi:16S rRNA (guanine527-N7)-methyltransferase